MTGAGRGLGLGIARAFAGQGAHVVLADLDAEAGEGAAQALGEAATFVRADVGDAGQVEEMVRHAVRTFGRLDVLVANAGIGARRLGDGPAHACTPEAWDHVMHVNLRGTFLSCKFALPHLVESRGAVVTLSSVLGVVGTQGLFDTHAYATSKAGIIGLTRAIAAHYARDGVRANSVAPGLIDTRMAARSKADPELLAELTRWQPLGALGEVRDVADACVFLASDESKFITGAVLPVDGGWTVQ
ncbi:oxidoreductase (plasmid) [Deinococcus aetherius]|uniref:Oxidoreductase n=1 Tax=Deinococcus aetherius TaxID=200252 RepID=A0ABN6RN00_9DEIO|nr:oxidoreductase [Deinococcus aetherius]